MLVINAFTTLFTYIGAGTQHTYTISPEPSDVSDQRSRVGVIAIGLKVLVSLKCPVKNPIKKGKRKVQGVPQSQTAALPRPQEEEETDKSKQAQTEQTYEKH